MIKIHPLSKDTVQQASNLANNVFSTREVPPSRALEASIDNAKQIQFRKELFEEHKITMLDFNYWVALDSGTEEVSGVIGLYTDQDDHSEAAWISWFCVGEAYRGKGVGGELIDFVVERTTREGKKYLRLFTSTDPNEAAAQKLYEKRGFRIDEKREKRKRGEHEIFYRELKLG